MSEPERHAKDFTADENQRILAACNAAIEAIHNAMPAVDAEGNRCPGCLGRLILNMAIQVFAKDEAVFAVLPHAHASLHRVAHQLHTTRLAGAHGPADMLLEGGTVGQA